MGNKPCGKLSILSLNMNRIIAILLLQLTLLGQSYTLPQLPRLATVTGNDLLPVWNGTNLYSSSVNALNTQFIPSTDGFVTNLTILGTLNTSGGSSPLRVDQANNRVHLRASGGAEPVNIVGIRIRLGADDSVLTTATVTSGVDKNFELHSYTRTLDNWAFLRAEATASAQTLSVGGGSGGFRGPTTVRLQAANGINATSRATLLTADGVASLVTANVPLRINANGTSMASVRHGRATLVAGSVVVSDANVTANTRIFVSHAVVGGTIGFLHAATRTAGTSFTVTSSSATDTSQVDWIAIEP